MRPGERDVVLVDGTRVSNYSPDWRHECEARHILAMPTRIDRREFLDGKPDQWGKRSGGIRQRRGEAEVKRLEATMLAIWNAGRAAPAA